MPDPTESVVRWEWRESAVKAISADCPVLEEFRRSLVQFVDGAGRDDPQIECRMDSTTCERLLREMGSSHTMPYGAISALLARGIRQGSTGIVLYGVPIEATDHVRGMVFRITNNG